MKLPASLSSSSALFLLLLQKAGGLCPAEALTAFLGTTSDIPFILNECLSAGLIRTDEKNTIYLVEDIDEEYILDTFSFYSRNYSSISLSFCMISFINKDYLSFLQSSLKIINTYYLKSNIDILLICYDIIAKMILKIRIIKGKRSDYIDFISIVKSIQKYATLVFLNSKYIFHVFYKIRSYAYYIGDMRTIYYVDLSIGAFNIIRRDHKKSMKNHTFMKKGVDGIFSIGDNDIILQSADLISLFYLINGEYFKNLAFHSSIIHKFSSSQSDRSIMLRVSFFSALGAISIGRYRKAKVIILSVLPWLKNATIFENKLIYSILGHIYTLMKDYTAADEVFLKIYHMHSYKTSFAHRLFSEYFIYFMYRKGIDSLDRSHMEILDALIRSKKIGYTYIFIPGYFEFFTSSVMRKLLNIDIYNIIDRLKEGMLSPFPLVQALNMRIYGYYLYYDMKIKDEAESFILKSIDICKNLHAHIEYTKGCLLMADICQARGQQDLMMSYINKSWQHYIRFQQPDWPEKYRGLASSGRVSETLTSVSCRNFFINLRHQNFFGHDQSFCVKVLRAFLLAFSLEKGLFVHFRKDGTHVMDACESMDKDYLFSSTFKYSHELINAVSEKKLVIISDPDEVDDRKENELTDIDVHLFFPFDVEDNVYLLYASGIIRSMHISALSQEFFEILRSYLITECIDLKRQEAHTVKKKTVDTKSDENQNNIYRSPEMKKLILQADRIASKDTTVLLLGESGVGKEVLARRIHQQSGRSGAFVGVNIASTPQELFESEFYGHEKGSFTGANYQKKGLFELADHGTLFIDEVGDIPMALQIKLLRVLQERQFMRVGGTKLIHSDFRLVAATNRNLLEKVQNGTFREDLYYRLHVIPIQIPPLRERPEDIRALAQFFLEQFSRQYDMEVRPFPRPLWDRMLSYEWPGNVRQLKNFVERYCLYMDSDLASSTSISSFHQDHHSESDDVFSRDMTIRELNDAYFEYMFKKKKGVISGKDSVISVLGISKPTAHAWMNRLHLRDKYTVKLVNDDEGA